MRTIKTIKTIKLVSALTPLLLTSVNAATIVDFNKTGIEASSGTIDDTGISYIQSFSSTQDFDGDGVDDVLTYSLTTTSSTGLDLNPTGTQYPFDTAGGDYIMALDVVSFVGSTGNSTVTSIDGTLNSFFKSGNGSYTVGNGIDSFTSSGNNSNQAAAIDFVGSEIIWSGNGNSGPRNLNLSLSVTTVPEPTSTALLGLGGLAFLIRRKR